MKASNITSVNRAKYKLTKSYANGFANPVLTEELGFKILVFLSRGGVQ